MLDKLIEVITGRKEVPVGVVTGELLEEWQRFGYKAQLCELEYEAKKVNFALNYFKQNNPDGKFITENIGEKGTIAFKEEFASYIAEREVTKADMKAERARLWRRTYEQLGIIPSGKYSIELATGKVTETIMDGGDSVGETSTIH